MIIKLRKHKFIFLHTGKVLAGAFLIALTIFSYTFGKSISPKNNTPSIQKKNYVKITPTPTPVQVAAIQEAIKKDPSQSPVVPKKAIANKKSFTGKTTTNSDGTKTTSGGEGGSSPELNSLSPSGVNNPLNIKIEDKTGSYPLLITPLKDYLNTLKWSTEIATLADIEIVDVGDTGWAGQYSFSYNQNQSGQVTSLVGLIKLNVFYSKDKSYFTDYMKLVLSHEYGHHYTQYYKLFKWKLLSGTRFPDQYYAIRPLTKVTTTFDYSLNWENCDAEIIAEDYSYIYSGYSYHGMSEKYGYPASPAISNWLANDLPGGPGASPVVPVVTPTDNPPTINITSPVDNSTVSSNITIQATASDDHAVSKVAFYIGDIRILEKTSIPYEATFNSGAYDNISYSIRAIATDDANHSTTATINLTFNNIKPIITINSPNNDPYTWTTGDLTIDTSAQSENSVSKIEIYINDQLGITRNTDHLAAVWSSSGVSAGTYDIKIKAYDQNGNIGTKTFKVIKQ